MENILLFAITVGIYSFIWFLFTDPVGWKKQVRRMALVALLVLPINIGGDVFTFAGNAIAEKSIYSIFSLYQKAEQNATTIISLAYQKTGQNAVTFAGLAYQQAGQDAVTIVGLTYQKAGRDAVTAAGLTYQKAGRDAVTIVGLAGYQKAERETKVPIAIAIYQRVGEKTRTFGAFSALTRD